MTWLLGIVFGFGVCFAAICAFDALGKRRTLRTLAERLCPQCGSRYGHDVAQAARDAHSAACREFGRKHPGVRYRISPEWKVACANCGATAMFNSLTWELRLLSESEQDPPR